MSTPSDSSAGSDSLKVLTPAQVEEFKEEGVVMLRDAFPREAADTVRNLVWSRLKAVKNVDRDDRSTWREGFVHLPETIVSPETEACYTPRVLAAFDDLLGEGRWNRPSGLGWWPVILPGFSSGEWYANEKGWHVDGQQFHHRLTSPDQGLLPIFLFSDMGPGDGGTGYDAGGHLMTARELAIAEPAGLGPSALCKAVNRHGHHNVKQVVGRAGDVALLHPFMPHTTTANVGTNVRFICNVCVTLKEPMQLEREDGKLSPVEEAIVRGLEVVRKA
ncbi:MAG: hypothetical protein NTW19_05545 [Planctomycetota bacterium]|nr:hypothetical protein [Planctomycetota bacterium]